MASRDWFDNKDADAAKVAVAINFQGFPHPALLSLACGKFLSDEFGRVAQEANGLERKVFDQEARIFELEAAMERIAALHEEYGPRADSMGARAACIAREFAKGKK